LGVRSECELGFKGLALKLGLAMANWCDSLMRNGGIQRVFPLGLGERCAFPSPVNWPVILGAFTGRLVEAFFGGSAGIYPPGVFSSDPIAAITDRMPARVLPPNL